MERALNQSISPADILTEAEAEPRQAPYYGLSEYAPAFVVLVNKGMCWTDVHRWALDHGIDRSKQSIVKATRAYVRAKGISLRGYAKEGE